MNYYIYNLRSDDEKVSLFMIIVSSFDDSLGMKCFDLNLWEAFSNIIMQDYELHEGKLAYWASYPEDDEEDCLEDCFYIALYVRDIIQKHRNNFDK